MAVSLDNKNKNAPPTYLICSPAHPAREQDVAEISRRMYEKIRSSRDPRDNVEDGRYAASARVSPPIGRGRDPG